MRKVGLDDLVGLTRYANLRADFRRSIMELKRDRRVGVGGEVTLVFENFDTIRFQIQEMLFVERIIDIDKIREECEVYNALLPDDRELSATLFIEITEQTKIADALNRLVGIDEHVAIHVGEHSSRARFEPGRSREDRISAVQYVRFPLDEATARAIATPGAAVRIVIDHPSYRAETTLSESQRASLAGDLAS